MLKVFHKVQGLYDLLWKVHMPTLGLFPCCPFEGFPKATIWLAMRDEVVVGLEVIEARGWGAFFWWKSK